MFCINAQDKNKSLLSTVHRNDRSTCVLHIACAVSLYKYRLCSLLINGCDLWISLFVVRLPDSNGSNLDAYDFFVDCLNFYFCSRRHFILSNATYDVWKKIVSNLLLFWKLNKLQEKRRFYLISIFLFITLLLLLCSSFLSTSKNNFDTFYVSVVAHRTHSMKFPYRTYASEEHTY